MLASYRVADLALAEILAGNCEAYDVGRAALARCQARDILEAAISGCETNDHFPHRDKKK
jgi:hypothetical protein